jgi:Cu(I)/Ag(I) efflux system membrane protein CusA/SilA
MGASVIEQAEAEYMVALKGYVSSIEDFADRPRGV